jgi:hypothetical protein
MGSCCSSADDDDDDDLRDERILDGVVPDEVHFEYDERTRRLVPIIEARPRRGAAGGGGGGDGTVRVIPDIGRSDESLVDCMSVSNRSFDIPLDDDNFARVSVESPRSLSDAPDDAAASGALGAASDGGAAGEKPLAPGRAADSTPSLSATALDMVATPGELIELEVLAREEIAAAFMAAVHIMHFAVRRITPTLRIVVGRGAIAANGERVSKGTNVTLYPNATPAAAASDAETGRMSPSEAPAREGSAPRLGDGVPGAPATAAVGGAGPAAAAPATMRVELLALDARGIPCDGGKVKSRMFDRWDFFSASPDLSARYLSRGDSLYAFKCFVGEAATADDVRLISPIANISVFRDEVIDNNVPRVDCGNPKDLKKYTIIISKAMYLLPGIDIHRDISPAHWATREYCEACLPGVPRLDDTTEPCTFRMHRPLIPYIYSLLIQLRISEITDPAVLRSLAQVDGFVPARALLYERTKRDKTKVDMTVKAKSILLFQQVPGGALVSNVTVVFNSAIPRIIAALVQNFGGSGGDETAEVASKTRRHIHQKFVVPRLRAAGFAA